MHICYIDDSGDATVRAFSVVAVPVVEWHSTFQAVKESRRTMRDRFGVFTTKELHATEFVGGRGRIAPTRLSKEIRRDISNEHLTFIATLPNVSLFNGIASKRDEFTLFERMLNRINRTMRAWDSYALLISDEGKDYNKIVRRMGVYNPIPSQFVGGASLNITLKNIVDEILYKRSQDSHFIQMADFCAYALLRSEIHLASKNAIGLHLSFDRLIPICQTQCYAKDPRSLGIIRAS